MGADVKKGVEAAWKDAKSKDKSASDLPGFIALLNRKSANILDFGMGEWNGFDIITFLVFPLLG